MFCESKIISIYIYWGTYLKEIKNSFFLSGWPLHFISLLWQICGWSSRIFVQRSYCGGDYDPCRLYERVPEGQLMKTQHVSLSFREDHLFTSLVIIFIEYTVYYFMFVLLCWPCSFLSVFLLETQKWLTPYKKEKTFF